MTLSKPSPRPGSGPPSQEQDEQDDQNDKNDRADTYVHDVSPCSSECRAQIRPANRPSHCPQSARPNQPTHPARELATGAAQHRSRQRMAALQLRTKPRLSRPVSASARSQCTAVRRNVAISDEPSRRLWTCCSTGDTQRRSSAYTWSQHAVALCTPTAEHAQQDGCDHLAEQSKQNRDAGLSEQQRVQR